MAGLVRTRHQEPNLADEGDHAMDGAFKLLDNGLTRKVDHATSKITGQPQRPEQSYFKAPLSNGFEQIQTTESGYGHGPNNGYKNEILETLCGPLLNYKHMSNAHSTKPLWHGSVLIVTKPGEREPQLHLKLIDLLHKNSDLQPNTPNDVNKADSGVTSSQERSFDGIKLYADPIKIFWRFDIELLLQEVEARWEYLIPDVRKFSDASSETSLSRSFVVPAVSQSMRIMFHSCNGFSVGTDINAWSGPVLWNDVLRVHEQKPFHVMIGGGDQIYNDGVRVAGPLRTWTEIGSPRKRREYQFDDKLRDECDSYYFENYKTWFSSEPFANANGRIPQINIWDDHDIIDGFGSYTDRFMKCPVFRGIGGVSLKYYSLFQHHVSPSKSTFTTSSPQTMHNYGPEGVGADPGQLNDTFVRKEEKAEPSFIIGKRPGPYVAECSRSFYTRLGARIAFLGIDARTERTRHQVNYPDTYDLIFQRMQSELSAAKDVRHLIVLLGVPIAYPRLAWLENIFKSPIIGPIRFLNKRFGIAGGFFNRFDGQVDLLDDLDDHYTARQHKHERKDLVLQLQALAHTHNVRISILGGDVHLAALGRFYSSPKLAIPIEYDHRYMANIISSAITNKPPPKAVANLLARRNKIHHLDHYTHETLMNLFDRDPGGASKNANWNHCTMPSRNYAIISETESFASSSSAKETAEKGILNGAAYPNGHAAATTRSTAKDGHSPLHEGEDGAGTQHAAASGFHSGSLEGGLDVSIRVEINQHDREGRTQGYGFSIPPLSGLPAKIAEA